jgi:hypothetical protein
MKVRIVLLAVVVLFATGGWDCFNENINVPVDVKFSAAYPINAGQNLTFGGTKSIVVRESVKESFRDDISQGRLYDIQVRATGTYNGSVAGSAAVNGVTFLTYSGNWSDFSEWQSLLGKSTHITPQAAGVNELATVLKNLSPYDIVYLSGGGTLSGQSPVPGGLAVEIQVLGQADAKIK